MKYTKNAAQNYSLLVKQLLVYLWGPKKTECYKRQDNRQLRRWFYSDIARDIH